MNRKYIAILIAAICPLTLAPLCRADDKPANTLDRALDDSTDSAKPAAPKTDAAKPDAVQPNKPDASQDTLNPDAANDLDDQDLVNKLTGKGPKGEGPEAMMKEILNRMGESAQRLHKQDPGPMTQETQKRITMNLDQLIELVRQQQQQSSSQSKSKSKEKAQQRERTQGNGPHNQGGNTAAQKSELPGNDSVAPEANSTDINQHSREWGNLPEHERDLIILGQKEESLPSYKELIRRYYQSLAEINKTTRDR